MGLAQLKQEIRKHADPAQAKNLMRFFKTGPGEYGEGDRFLGLTVPLQRAIARRHRDLPAAGAEKLLASRVHEDRLIALPDTHRALRQGRRCGAGLHRPHLPVEYRARQQLGPGRPVCAPCCWAGTWPNGTGGLLFRLARSRSLWERRIAIIATLAFIRMGDLDTTFAIAEVLLRDDQDLIHKAAGWMLREAWKKDGTAGERFLDRHAAAMPRTMLRYAIERLPENKRRAYLAAGRQDRRPAGQRTPSPRKKSR